MQHARLGWTGAAIAALALGACAHGDGGGSRAHVGIEPSCGARGAVAPDEPYEVGDVDVTFPSNGGHASSCP